MLEKSDAASKIIAHWECGVEGEKLIDSKEYKVQITAEKEKEIDYHGDERLKLIKMCGSSKDHAKIRKIFDQHEQQNIDLNVIFGAKEIIQKR